MSPVSRFQFSRELKIMAKNRKTRKTESSEHSENPEKNQELMSKDEELQMFKKDQVDYHHEPEENEVFDILLVFMNNNGFKRIADRILSSLDWKSFVQCRPVCRSWKNFIDNEWSMLQRQIFHLKMHSGEIDENDDTLYWEPNIHGQNFGPLFTIMEKNTNKSELRVFIKMCQEFLSRHCNLKLKLNPLEYMIDHHRHLELKILLHIPKEKDPDNFYPGFACFTRIFKYACQYGCEICVKLILDRSEEKEIDLNSMKERWRCDICYKGDECHEYEHCLFVAKRNRNGFTKDVLDLLLRSAEEKGIDIHAKSTFGGTLRDHIIGEFKIGYTIEIEDYTEATYRILNIDPSVDLKRRQ